MVAFYLAEIDPKDALDSRCLRVPQVVVPVLVRFSVCKEHRVDESVRVFFQRVEVDCLPDDRPSWPWPRYPADLSLRLPEGTTLALLAAVGPGLCLYSSVSPLSSSLEPPSDLLGRCS